MRREDPKTLVNSFLLGLVIALIAAVVLRPLYEKEQAERKKIAEEWVQEQIRADRAYQLEVEAEKARWDAIEEEERLATITENATEAAEVIFDDTRIPDDIEEAARKWGEVYDIEPEFLEAVAWAESRFDPEAVNGGCVGLMQVSPYWHHDRMERLGVDEDGLYTVDGSMAVAADYFRELMDTGNDTYWVLMTYNGDSRAPSYLKLEEGPSEYALIIYDLTFELIETHKEGGSASWLEY